VTDGVSGFCSERPPTSRRDQHRQVERQIPTSSQTMLIRQIADIAAIMTAYWTAVTLFSLRTVTKIVAAISRMSPTIVAFPKNAAGRENSPRQCAATSLQGT
jgi:hypothetical protein